jgi:hypothetical protein
MHTFTTPTPIDVSIDMGVGSVRLVASDRTDTVVDVRPADSAATADVEAAERSTVDHVNGQLTVAVPNKKTLRTLFGRPAQVDVTIELPTGSRVDADVTAPVHGEGTLGDATIATGAGAVRLEVTGRLKLRTGAGDVSVGRVAGAADLKTATGKIRVGDVAGPVVAKTANGDVTLGTADGHVRIRTAAGDIAVERALESVVAKTAAGSIRIGEVVRGSVHLETAAGELEIGVREGTAAWLDVTSGSGSVRSELESTDRPGPADETVEVKGKTGWGDVVIRRSRPAARQAAAPQAAAPGADDATAPEAEGPADASAEAEGGTP